MIFIIMTRSGFWSVGYLIIVFLFSFFLIKKKQKIKTDRSGIFRSAVFSSHDPSPDAQDIARSFMQDFSCVIFIDYYCADFSISGLIPV